MTRMNWQRSRQKQRARQYSLGASNDVLWPSAIVEKIYTRAGERAKETDARIRSRLPSAPTKAHRLERAVFELLKIGKIPGSIRWKTRGETYQRHVAARMRQLTELIEKQIPPGADLRADEAVLIARFAIDRFCPPDYARKRT